MGLEGWEEARRPSAQQGELGGGEQAGGEAEGAGPGTLRDPMVLGLGQGGW